jgi:hypothetical protein
MPRRAPVGEAVSHVAIRQARRASKKAHVILTKPSQRGDVLNALSSPWSARLLAKRISAPDPAGIGAPLFVGHCSRGQRRLRAGAEDEDHDDDRKDCSNHWISSVCTLRSR